MGVQHVQRRRFVAATCQQIPNGKEGSLRRNVRTFPVRVEGEQVQVTVGS